MIFRAYASLKRDAAQCLCPTGWRRCRFSANESAFDSFTIINDSFKTFSHARVTNAAMACWSTPDRGVIHTAVEDEVIGWLAPTTRMIGNDSKWKFVDGAPPTFGRREHWDVGTLMTTTWPT